MLLSGPRAVIGSQTCGKALEKHLSRGWPTRVPGCLGVLPARAQAHGGVAAAEQAGERECGRRVQYAID